MKLFNRRYFSSLAAATILLHLYACSQSSGTVKPKEGEPEYHLTIVKKTWKGQSHLSYIIAAGSEERMVYCGGNNFYFARYSYSADKGGCRQVSCTLVDSNNAILEKNDLQVTGQNSLVIARGFIAGGKEYRRLKATVYFDKGDFKDNFIYFFAGQVSYNFFANFSNLIDPQPQNLAHCPYPWDEYLQSGRYSITSKISEEKDSVWDADDQGNWKLTIHQHHLFFNKEAPGKQITVGNRVGATGSFISSGVDTVYTKLPVDSSGGWIKFSINDQLGKNTGYSFHKQAPDLDSEVLVHFAPGEPNNPDTAVVKIKKIKEVNARVVEIQKNFSESDISDVSIREISAKNIESLLPAMSADAQAVLKKYLRYVK